MNVRIILISIAVILLSANIYLHKHNQSLSDDIARYSDQCEKKLAMLQERYANRAAREIKTTPTQVGDINNAAPPQTVKPKVNLEKLISHAHRVQAITNKYEFLLTTAEIEEADKIVLRRLLLKREQFANEIAFAEHENTDAAKLKNQLDKIENQIEVVLTDPVDFMRYEFLRERSL